MATQPTAVTGYAISATYVAPTALTQNKPVAATGTNLPIDGKNPPAGRVAGSGPAPHLEVPQPHAGPGPSSATGAPTRPPQPAHTPPTHTSAADANPGGSAASTHAAALDAEIAQLNKYLNDSGRPTQYRIDRSSGAPRIQEVNPSNGKVVAELPVADFPALARSLGVSGVLVNQLA